MVVVITLPRATAGVPRAISIIAPRASGRRNRARSVAPAGKRHDTDRQLIPSGPAQQICFDPARRRNAVFKRLEHLGGGGPRRNQQNAEHEEKGFSQRLEDRVRLFPGIGRKHYTTPFGGQQTAGYETRITAADQETSELPPSRAFAFPHDINARLLANAHGKGIQRFMASGRKKVRPARFRSMPMQIKKAMAVSAHSRANKSPWRV